MPQNTNRDQVQSPICTGFAWKWLVTMVAILAAVIAFRRLASNERIAYAVAVGATRRRRESTTLQPPTSESSSK